MAPPPFHDICHATLQPSGKGQVLRTGGACATVPACVPDARHNSWAASFASTRFAVCLRTGFGPCPVLDGLRAQTTPRSSRSSCGSPNRRQCRDRCGVTQLRTPHQTDRKPYRQSNRNHSHTGPMRVGFSRTCHSRISGLPVRLGLPQWKEFEMVGCDH
jgi:hypothetical protein